jgi:hypothetical protein
VVVLTKPVPYHDMTPVRLRGRKVYVVIPDVSTGSIKFDVDVPHDMTDAEHAWIVRFVNGWITELQREYPFIGFVFGSETSIIGED